MYFLEVKDLVGSFPPLCITDIVVFLSTLPLRIHRMIFVAEYG